jgi:putative drug exporter of the RND superfamily
MMSSLTHWVLDHKRTVVVVWLLLTVAGIAAAGPAADALTPGYSVPGKEGWETNQAIAATYGGTGTGTAPLVPLFITDSRSWSEMRPMGSKTRRVLPRATAAQCTTCHT